MGEEQETHRELAGSLSETNVILFVWFRLNLYVLFAVRTLKQQHVVLVHLLDFTVNI